MTERDEAAWAAEVVRAAARRHGLSEGAVEALWDALVRGRGQAQFSHPGLGGMGQWSGGMLQIGDMFNAGLKAKVAAACVDLAAQAGKGRDGDLAPRQQREWRGTAAPAASSGAEAHRTSVPRTGISASVDGLGPARAPEPAGWWPGHYGAPASLGSQNGMRYASFPDRHRLVVERDGRIAIYDTSHHWLSGVSQQQSHHQTLAFTSQHGPIGLESFVEVDD